MEGEAAEGEAAEAPKSGMSGLAHGLMAKAMSAKEGIKEKASSFSAEQVGFCLVRKQASKKKIIRQFSGQGHGDGYRAECDQLASWKVFLERIEKTFENITVYGFLLAGKRRRCPRRRLQSRGMCQENRHVYVGI